MFTARHEEDLEGRPGLQDQVRGALESRGRQVLLFGETGVGKSSLIKIAAGDASLKALSIACLDRSYEQIMEDCISQLLDFREVSFSEEAARASERKAGVGIARLMTITGRTKVEYGNSRQFHASQKEPVDVLVDAMEATGHDLVVLDNFQNVRDHRTRRLILQTMERLSDRASATNNMKMVVVGLADDAASVLPVEHSDSSARRVAVIGVPRMPDEEVQQIFRNGFGLLGLVASEETLNQLTPACDGFPYVAHLIGATVSRVARLANTTQITDAIVQHAMRVAASEVGETVPAHVGLALRGGGRGQARRRVLELLVADRRRTTWTGSDIVRLFEKMHGERYDWRFLNTALLQLTTSAYGSLLRRTTTSGRATYSFSNSHIRPYLLLQASTQAQLPGPEAHSRPIELPPGT